MISNEEKQSLLQNQDSVRPLSLSSRYSEPESHLQSLGFTMENGRPRFKLGNDAPVSPDLTLTNFEVDDQDDTLSFVVLGKDSLCSIQESSVASFVNIQLKSMSVDYDSMIASLNSAEVHQKLNELLQENTKLKETLKQNNVAMKQQFNTLVSWQEEIMKVHQNHKKKFAETRELLNYLKQENADLKVKLASEQPNNPAEISLKCEFHSIISTQNCEKGKEKEEEKEEENSIPTKELEGKVSLLTDELNSSKLKCEKLSSDIEKLLFISELTSSQLVQATSTIQEQRFNIQKLEEKGNSMSKSNEPNCFNQILNQSSTSEQLNSVNHCAECDKCPLKDKEINSLKGLVAMIEHKLEHDMTPFQLCMKNLTNSKNLCQWNSLKIRKYNEKLQELRSCLSKQLIQCISIKKHLEDFTQELETKVLYDFVTDAEHFLKVKDEVLSCYKKFAEERQKYFEHTKNIHAEQNQLQKAFLDCWSIGCELETILCTTTDTDSMGKDVSESVQTTPELAKENADVKRLLEEEKLSLSKEREKFEEEKNVLNDQKKALELERKELNEAKELIQQERISLLEEKSSLDQQSQLYESHYKKSLETEKKQLDPNYEKLGTEIDILRVTINQKEQTIKELQTEIKQHLENVHLLETQLKLYEEDFKQENKIKERLLKEKSTLNTDLRNQMEFTIKLQQEIEYLKTKCSVGSGTNTKLEPPLMSTFTCPKCDCTFRDVQSLEAHVNHCLNLD